MNAYVSAKRPTADVTRPGTSGRCSCDVSRDSSTNAWIATRPSTPIGTLMKKIQFQFTCSVSRPPTSGPIASAIAETPAQMPIALPGREGGGDDRQRRGVHQRAAEPLHDARSDQEAAVRRKPAGKGRARE